uniref:Uncharacterized protein n=1 Tax=Cacopsylla melanoneura TaxID=428564 RepID=A0A8D9EAD4_9HEMI
MNKRMQEPNTQQMVTIQISGVEIVQIQAGFKKEAAVKAIVINCIQVSVKTAIVSNTGVPTHQISVSNCIQILHLQSNQSLVVWTVARIWVQGPPLLLQDIITSILCLVTSTVFYHRDVSLPLVHQYR